VISFTLSSPPCTVIVGDLLQLESIRSVYANSQTAVESLDCRLNEVRRLVPLAAHHAKEDSEYVHQLRISTREALAAIDAYAPLLPVKESESLGKSLRRIRSAAGKARDLDVMSASHRNSKPKCRKWLIRLLRGRRKCAQRPLVRISKRFNRQQCFDVWIKACLDAVRDIPSDDIAAVVMDRTEKAAEALVCGAPDTDASAKTLHRFRVKAKQLRYCLELSGLADPGSPLHHLYLTACEIQKKLGVMNDHQVASKLYRRIGRKAKSRNRTRRMERLTKIERAKARTTQKDFRSWWHAVPKIQKEMLNSSNRTSAIT
jgi:CHAD domain-containing protein